MFLFYSCVATKHEDIINDLLERLKWTNYVHWKSTRSTLALSYNTYQNVLRYILHRKRILVQDNLFEDVLGQLF